MIKKGLNKIKNVYGNVFEKYPISIIMVILVTLYSCIAIILEENSNISFEAEDTLTWWIVFGVYFTVGIFGIETLSKKFFEKHMVIKKAVGIGIMAIISVVLVSIMSRMKFGVIEIQFPNYVTENRQLSWSFMYFVVIVLSVLYNRYKESGHSAEEYFVGVFTGIIKLLFSWGLLALGVLLLSLVFDELITSIEGAGAIVPQILIIGLYVVPYAMMDVTEIKDAVEKFFENLIKYVLLILTIIGAVIIYLYIIKTIITGIPSNEIFGITSALFFVAIPVGFACTAFEKNTFLQKIAYLLPYVYAPFIVLQVYAIYVRIAEYGLTPSRYMGIVLIVLEVLYTVVYALFRKHIDKLLPAMMVITACVTVIPGINICDASDASQLKVIREFIKNGVPEADEDCFRLKGAYDFLRREYGNDYFDKMLSVNQLNTLSELSVDSEDTWNQCKECYILTDLDYISVAEYEYVSEFDCYYYQSSENGAVDTENIMLHVNDMEFGPYDLSDLLDNCLNNAEEAGNNFIDKSETYKVDDDCEIIFDYIDTRKNVKHDEYEKVHLGGYILFTEEYLQGENEKK